METPKPTEIAQEHELHQLIVDSLDRLPVEMRGGTEDEVLAWAHELRIHDSGRREHADGYADILTLDEKCRTWIVLAHTECPMFDKYAARRKAKLTTASFADSLNQRVRPLWDNVVEPFLRKERKTFWGVLGRKMLCASSSKKSKDSAMENDPNNRIDHYK